MEDKKELTKDLLTASFRELVLQIPFEKITIKMITDGAGVIRPTRRTFMRIIPSTIKSKLLKLTTLESTTRNIC